MKARWSAATACGSRGISNKADAACSAGTVSSPPLLGVCTRTAAGTSHSACWPIGSSTPPAGQRLPLAVSTAATSSSSKTHVCFIIPQNGLRWTFLLDLALVSARRGAERAGISKRCSEGAFRQEEWDPPGGEPHQEQDQNRSGSQSRLCCSAMCEEKEGEGGKKMTGG